MPTKKTEDRDKDIVLPCGLVVRHTYAPGRERNYMHLKFQDTSGEVLDDNDNRIGAVNAYSGGVEIEIGEDVFSVSALELWQFIRTQLGKG